MFKNFPCIVTSSLDFFTFEMKEMFIHLHKYSWFLWNIYRGTRILCDVQTLLIPLIVVCRLKWSALLLGESRSENTYVRKCKVNFLKGGDFTDFSLKRNLFHIYTVKKIFGVIFFNICVRLVKLNIHIRTSRHKYSDIL